MATIDVGKLTFTHKGDYAGGTAYVLNDVVYYNGSAYVAKTSTTGNLPTSTAHWNNFAAGSGGIWNSGLSIGSAGQQLQVNSGGNALEFTTPSGGITEADQFRLSASQSMGGSEITLTNWERPDDTESSLGTFDKIGTGMSHSSGTFTFPSTGIYLVRFVAKSQTGAQAANYCRIYLSKDGSNYDRLGGADLYIENGFNNVAVVEYMCDITNTSNDLMQFRAVTSSGTSNVLGNTDQTMTSVTFIRLGDT